MLSLTNFECNICNMKFLKMEFLNIHMKKVHNESENDRINRLTQAIQNDADSKQGRKIFDCSECGIIFGTSQEQQSHTKQQQTNKVNPNIVIKSEPIDLVEDERSYPNTKNKPNEYSESETDEEGEVKNELFKYSYYGGDTEDEIQGSTIKYIKGKKGDFEKAYEEIKCILKPGTQHTIKDRTLDIKSENKRRRPLLLD